MTASAVASLWRLQSRIDLFKNRGRIARFNEQFLFVEAIGCSDNRRVLQNIREVCREKVLSIPTQADFIVRHCAAPKS